jgi:hypothetical protein
MKEALLLMQHMRGSSVAKADQWHALDTAAQFRCM